MSTCGQLVLQDRRIAYAITDRYLKVVEVGGAVPEVLIREGVVDEADDGRTPVRYIREGDDHIRRDDPRTWLGRSLPELVPDLVGSEDALADVLAGKLPRLELCWASREPDAGGATYLTMVDLPYRDQQGRIAGIIHIVQDVTDAGLMVRQLVQNRNELRLLRDRLAEQNLELAVANAELRRLDEIKSTFISVAAHELRTPLAPLRGYLEVLLDEEIGHLNDEQREYLAVVEESARRLMALASNLLDVTRIEAGRVELVLRPADLEALVGTAVAEYGPQWEARSQHLTLCAAPDLPPALCDEMRALQIIGNLLSNASKYTPEGGAIRVSLALAQEEGFLQVSVSDSGVGIPPEDQPNVFTRFFRARTAILTRADGAGLGLCIARPLVEQHGGRIWFESEPGQGSTFHVTFPIADRPAPDLSA